MICDGLRSNRSSLYPVLQRHPRRAQSSQFQSISITYPALKKINEPLEEISDRGFTIPMTTYLDSWQDLPGCSKQWAADNSLFRRIMTPEQNVM